MQWYDTLQRQAHKPPAYMVERISDLSYASDLAQTSPGNAKAILDDVISQLEVHLDHEYVEDLRAASRVMLDNPQKAKNLIGIVVGFMRADKRKYDIEREKPWMRKWRR